MFDTSDRGDSPTDPQPLPEDPASPEPDFLDDIDPAVQDALWEQDFLAYEADLATLPPAERFERQFGSPPEVDAGVFTAEASQDAAAWLQQLAVDATRMRTLADAHRIRILLAAYEASMRDLALRYPTKAADPDGLGGQAFFRTMGLLTRTHPIQVSTELAAGLTLRDRLPQTWAAFQAGDASWQRARTAVAQADGLDAEHWPAYDAEAARLVVSSYRLKDDLRKQRERLQDDTAAKRARTTHERRRTSLELGADSGVAFIAEGLATTWVPINDALHNAAVAAHGTDPLGRSIAQLRHDIAADILHTGLQTSPDSSDEAVLVPNRKPVQVTLILTVPALAWLGHTQEQAQLAGYGPIDMETAKDLAADAKSFIRVLTHPFTGARLAMDRTTYSPPTDLARWVRIRDGRSRFPGSTRPAHLSDIDHAREWQHHGRTEDTNLITLDRPTHNGKTAGLFQEELEDSGIVGWTDAWRHYFQDPPQDPLDPAPPELIPPATSPPDDDDDSPF